MLSPKNKNIVVHLHQVRQVVNTLMSWIQCNILLFNVTDILPKKILARDYLKSLEQMQEEDADF